MGEAILANNIEDLTLEGNELGRHELRYILDAQFLAKTDNFDFLAHYLTVWNNQSIHYSSWIGLMLHDCTVATIELYISTVLTNLVRRHENTYDISFLRAFRKHNISHQEIIRRSCYHSA